MEEKLQRLQNRLKEIYDLKGAIAVLQWDQLTYMPPGGGAARARQLATLGKFEHQRLTDPTIGKLVEELEPYEKNLPYDSFARSLIRLTRRHYEKAVKLPAHFISEFYSHLSATYAAWSKAKPSNDFKSVQPYLEKTLDLSRQYASFFPGYEHIADPLISVHDYGVKASEVKVIFRKLREGLLPIVNAITEKEPIDDSFLQKDFPEEIQMAFTIDVLKKIGYDFERGRIDKTLHPFMISFSLGDVRITTRTGKNNFTEMVFSAVHEAGHALYEQGINPDFEGTPLAEGCSGSIHESQSRMWENIIGRSRGFWTFFYPSFQQKFAPHFDEIPMDRLYRAINKVQRSLIRTEADEVTYNLHVMIRFELEMQLLEGKLAVKDLPEAWRNLYRENLGITPENDTEGVMQDVHWYSGLIGGAFQSYTLGNLQNAQFLAAAKKQHPAILEEVAQGNFSTLLNWCRENIYRHGSTYTSNELVQKVTGKPLDVTHYLEYLEQKYKDIYHF